MIFLSPIFQHTGTGSHTLTLPSVSSSFKRSAQQIAKLGSTKQPIYIVAENKLRYHESEEC
jgi:hypothetical protein